MKKRLLELCYNNRLHHLSSYFTSIDIISDNYSEKKEDDIFILSAGHAVAALYVVLENKYGLDAQKLLETHGEHPKFSKEDRIYCSTGSLGMGLTVAVGYALANRDRDVYCLISDGEAAEGCIWESLAFCYIHKINNLKLFVNANGFCAYDKVDVDYLESRIKAFLPSSVFCRTSNEEFPFLGGLEGHYKTLTLEEYEKTLDLFNA